MKFRLFFTLLILVLFSNAQNIQVWVKNNRNQPVSECLIKHKSIAIGYTDSNGLIKIINFQLTDTFNAYKLGYKSHQFLIFNSNNDIEIVLQDSSIELKPADIKPYSLKTTVLGNFRKTNRRFNSTMPVYEGYLLASEFKIKEKEYYLNELGFYLDDFYLPDSNRFLGIKVCNCFNGYYDTSITSLFFPEVILKIDKRKSWYTVKLDTLNRKIIDQSCLTVLFEVKQKLNQSQLDTDTTFYRKYFIGLELTKKNEGITTKYFCIQKTKFELRPNTFRSGWNNVYKGQKLYIKLSKKV